MANNNTISRSYSEKDVSADIIPDNITYNETPQKIVGYVEYTECGYCSNDSKCQTSPQINTCQDNITQCLNEYQEDDEFNEDNECDENQYRKVHLYYDEIEEIENEKECLEYHTKKLFGSWNSAKIIISHSYANKNLTEFVWDYFYKLFQSNNDDFDNIHTVYYKNDLDLDFVYQFDDNIAKFVVDNMKIPVYKQNGFIFNNDENVNKWTFKIIIITNKGVYTANRYINDNLIGFY